MSTRHAMQLEGGVLLALALFLLNAGCPQISMPSSMKSPPSFDGLSQGAELQVDDLSDGSIEDSDIQVLMNVSPPVEIARASSNNTVILELDADSDSILFTCVHELSSLEATTRCVGIAHGAFEIAENAGAAEFTLAVVLTPADPPSEVSQEVDVRFAIDCGAGSVLFALSDFDADRQRIAQVAVDGGASECTVAIDLAKAEVVSTGVVADIIQTVSITARKVAPVDCQHESQCAPGEKCSPDGLCTLGLEGSTCDVASVHCTTEFCNEFRECSDGHAASFARGSFECAAGYTFKVFECLGDDCTNDADCPLARPICTDRGCSETGERGAGCGQGSGCRSGICLNNFCTEVVNQGDDCATPHVLCAFGLNCFNSSGTCEVPFDTGDDCTGNEQCNFPSDSCIGGVCAPRSASGGPCDVGDDSDCGTSLLTCSSAGVCT